MNKSIINKLKEVMTGLVGAKLLLNGCHGNKDWRSYLLKHQVHILG